MEPFGASHACSRVGNMSLALPNPLPSYRRLTELVKAYNPLSKPLFMAVNRRYFTPSWTKSGGILYHIWMVSTVLFADVKAAHYISIFQFQIIIQNSKLNHPL